MSGGPVTKTKANTGGATTGKTALNTSTAQSSTSSMTPYAAAMPGINSLLGQATQMLNGPNIGAQYAKQYLPGVMSGIDSGISGMTGAFNQGSDALGRVASGEFLDGENPYQQQLMASLNNNARNTVGSAFSDAGRSFSGAHAGALGTALTNAQAPYLFNNYNQQIGNMMGAGANLGSMGFGYSNAMDAAQLAKLQAAGIGAQLPYTGLNAASNLLLPIAGQFGTTNSTGTQTGSQSGTQSGTQSGWQTGKTSQQNDPMQTMLGGGLGLLGLLSMGSGGGLMGKWL
jgi:hypothetical protein